MRFRQIVRLATVLLVFAARAEAKPPLAQAAPARPAPGSVVRRDPRGVKGISPFQEALKKGDDAFIAGDFDAAIVAYREAITDEPDNALGDYRLGEAQLEKADLVEAEAAFVAGLHFVAADAKLTAKLQFALADLRERQKAYDQAAAKWTDYQTLTSEPAAGGFPATAIERKIAIEAWKKLSVQAAEVKARIAQRLAAADESLRKSSK